MARLSQSLDQMDTTPDSADPHSLLHHSDKTANTLDAAHRNSRLARKAESARQARLRHKHFVNELQDQVATLQSRLQALEARARVPSANQAIRELKAELDDAQLLQLTQW